MKNKEITHVLNFTSQNVDENASSEILNQKNFVWEWCCRR